MPEPTRKRPLFNRTDAKRLAQEQVNALNQIRDRLNTQNREKASERMKLVIDMAISRLGVNELVDQIDALEQQIAQLRAEIEDLMGGESTHLDFRSSNRKVLASQLATNTSMPMPKALKAEIDFAMKQRGITPLSVGTLPMIHVEEIFEKVASCTTQEELEATLATFQMAKLSEMGMLDNVKIK